MNNPNEHGELDTAFEEQVKQAVTLKEREGFMSFVNELEQEYQSSQGATVRSLLPRRWMSVAAAMLILVAAFFIVKQIGQPSAERLVAQYYEPFPNTFNPITRSGLANEMSVEKHGLIAYESEDYKKALDYFNEMVDINDDIRLVKSIAYYEIGEYDKAKAGLQMIIGHEGSLKRDAQWYMGLILLKEGYIDQAKRYFEVLADQPSDSSRQQDAQDILKKL